MQRRRPCRLELSLTPPPRSDVRMEGARKWKTAEEQRHQAQHQPSSIEGRLSKVC